MGKVHFLAGSNKTFPLKFYRLFGCFFVSTWKSWTAASPCEYSCKGTVLYVGKYEVLNYSSRHLTFHLNPIELDIELEIFGRSQAYRMGLERSFESVSEFVKWG